MNPADLDHCRAAIRTGSLSFHAASKLLPNRVRDPALALYAFCRLADDAVDEGTDKAGAVLSLNDRLDRVYRGQPRNAPADRAFAAVVETHDMPRILPEALLEGLAWDARGYRPETLSQALDYSARVASSVGAMMAVLMGVRDAPRLARACDLGLAMQLTNIARDVGEDARAGRLYLPADWLDEAGISPAALLADPRPTPALLALIARLLHTAEALYHRSEPGIAALPLDCRPGIFAARHVYAAIGHDLVRHGCDSVTRRARTSGATKLRLLTLAAVRSAVSTVTPVPATLHAAPAPEVAFLVNAATRRSARPDRSETLLAILGQLRARDLAARGEQAVDRPPGSSI
ncbi:MAG: 15-cis-phytoene synthase [Pararhodobacter sp.]